MRHYEIVFLVHPDQSEQVAGMVERYTSAIEAGKVPFTVLKTGDVVNWLIQSIKFTRHVLMNVECDQDILDELNSSFRYNDAVLRSMVIRRDEAITQESPIMKQENAEKADKEARERQKAAKAKESADKEEAVAEAEVEEAEAVVEAVVEEAPVEEAPAAEGDE